MYGSTALALEKMASQSEASVVDSRTPTQGLRNLSKPEREIRALAAKDLKFTGEPAEVPTFITPLCQILKMSDNMLSDSKIMCLQTFLTPEVNLWVESCMEIAPNLFVKSLLIQLSKHYEDP
jgi:hypothetical protein